MFDVYIVLTAVKYTHTPMVDRMPMVDPIHIADAMPMMDPYHGGLNTHSGPHNRCGPQNHG